MKTQNGIELKIEESKFIYEFLGYLFYFSSEFYLNKFKNNVLNYIEEEKIKLFNKYKIKNLFDLYLSFAFYKRIEKRGFYIVHKKDNKIFTNETEFISLI